MRGRDIVEREDAVAELEEEVRAEGDEGPEWELWRGCPCQQWSSFDLGLVLDWEEEGG